MVNLEYRLISFPLAVEITGQVANGRNTETGTFYWQPGPGFIGRYRLVFLRRDRNGDMFKIPVEITIVPKF